MQYLVYLQSNGEIIKQVSGSPESVAEQAGEGEAIIEGSGSWMTHRVVNGEVVALPEPRNPPFFGALWDRTLASWYDPRGMETKKADKWAEIKRIRDDLMDTPKVTSIGTFDATPEAQDNLNKVIALLLTARELGETNLIASFTLADNSRPSFTLRQLQTAGLEIGAQIQAIRDTASILRSRINSAQTDAELDQITWS